MEKNPAKGGPTGIEQHGTSSLVSGRESSPAELDSLIRDFLKILKVAFKMAAIYRIDHPAFKQIVIEFMAKLESLFKLISPLSIGFTPHSLFIGNRFWEDEKTFIELAQLFHLRKIKKLEFRRGISLDELSRFAAKITLPIKDYIKAGGIRTILQGERIVHVSAEELDYAQLLRGEGEEIKDIWPYLLMEAVEEDDRAKLDQLAESFDKVSPKFNTEDLIENDDLQRHFGRFFSYLKETSEEKYRICAKGLLKSLIAVRKVPPETKAEQLKLLLRDMGDQDMASTLWEEILGNDKFDSLSFSVFSKLIAQDRHAKVSSSLHEHFRTDHHANRRPEVERKIKALLSGTSGFFLSEVYRQTLTGLLSEIAFEKKMEFDRVALGKSYRNLLLNLLARETAPEAAAKTLERIIEEWKAVSEEENLEYLRRLLDVLDAKKEALAAAPAYQTLQKALSELIETLILRGDSSSNLNAFIDPLGRSLHGPELYLDALFVEKTVTPTLLRAYFVFFGTCLADFKDRLEKSKTQSRLLERIADSLKDINSPMSLDCLKSIYRLGEQRIKGRALKAMEGQSDLDERFLFAALDDRDDEIKGEALVLLAKQERSRYVALAKLLNLQSPYGTRNKILIKNIRIIEAKDLREARPFLKSLAQRKDFWNRRVRQEAFRVLEAWGEG